MPVLLLAIDTRQALHLLERIQKKLHDTEEVRPGTRVSDDLHLLIGVLESPVFQGILTIQDSLKELKRQLHKHPSILPIDFDINKSGELILNIPTSNPTPPHVPDPYDSGYEVGSSHGYEYDDAKGRSKPMQDQDKLGRTSIGGGQESTEVTCSFCVLRMSEKEREKNGAVE